MYIPFITVAHVDTFITTHSYSARFSDDQSAFDWTPFAGACGQAYPSTSLDNIKVSVSPHRLMLRLLVSLHTALAYASTSEYSDTYRTVEMGMRVMAQSCDSVSDAAYQLKWYGCDLMSNDQVWAAAVDCWYDIRG